MLLTRRSLVRAAAGAAALAAPAVVRAESVSQPPRVVCLDWTGAEMLMTLGLTPIGVVDRDGYRRIVGQPELPPEVADLGGAWAPNLELIQSLRPDLVLLPQWPGNFARAGSIAPTYIVETYGDDGVLAVGRAELLRLAEKLGVGAHGALVIDDLDRRLDAAKRAVVNGQAATILYLQINRDGRHVTVSTPKSLPGTVLARLGIKNAWRGAETTWGFVFTGIETIADYPDAQLIYADQGPDTRLGLRRLHDSIVWQRLASIQAGRITGIDAVYSYGGYASAVRLATILAKAVG